MSKTSTIKNIIFDLGGVILNIDYQRTENAFKELGGDRFEAIFSKFKQQNFFDDFEKGHLSSQKFRERIRQEVSSDLSDEEIDAAWNDMLLDLPEGRLTMLYQLKSHYRTFLLSNTNPIHYEAFHQIIEEQHGITSLGPYFEEVYYSNKMGLRKPDKAIFQSILDQHKLQPTHTLFIDDSPQHAEGAEKLGLQTHHLKDDETIEDVLARYKLMAPLTE